MRKAGPLPRLRSPYSVALLAYLDGAWQRRLGNGAFVKFEGRSPVIRAMIWGGQAGGALMRGDVEMLN
jgi:hypothetical protein